jgi:ubiquinone/menaquinone biosynthesis C-methylase UbiE
LRRRAVVDLGVLVVLGVALVALTGRMAGWPDVTARPQAYAVALVAQLVVYALAACWVVVRRPDARGALAVIVLAALAARVAFVSQAPTVSDDIFRYVWDGRIQAQGINPYRYPPADPALAAYRDDEIYAHVNRKAVPTIYPPVAQGIFRALYAVYPDSVAWTRLALAGFDLVTMLVIAGLLARLGQRPERVILYAWHPLLILELGHSGHLDVAAITFLMLALWTRLGNRPVLTGVLLACAALTKFYAVVALPALLWPGVWRSWREHLRLGLAGIATAALAYLPFLGVGRGIFGYLGGYVREEGIASGDRFYLLRQARRMAGEWPIAPPRWIAEGLVSAAQGYQVLVVGALGVLGLWCWLWPRRSDREIAGRALALFLVLFALTSPSYPWYTLFALTFVPFVGWRLLVPASVLVGTAGFLYLQWWWPGQTTIPAHVAYSAPIAALALVGAVSVARRRVACAARPPDPAPARRLRALPGGNGARAQGALSAAPREGETASLFDRFPWCYAFCRERLFLDHTERIAAALWTGGAPRAGEALLEVGCGPGFYARRLAARHAQLRVVGIDLSPAQVNRARRAARDLGNCHFLRGDARALAQPTESVDAVVASRLFTILPERERALAEMYRVIRPGGVCFVAEPRSRFGAAIPLRALWLLARLARLGGRGAACYREPARATVLRGDEFAALIGTQPWAEARLLHDRRYRYAICRKAERPIEMLAAD